MAKPEKKKSALHKHVSSVLKGVPIPQGVRNWRPPGKGANERVGDSTEAPQGDVSSVFRGASVPGGDVGRVRSEKSLDDCRVEAPATDSASDRETSRAGHKHRQSQEESPIELRGNGEQTARHRVVCYHDPVEEALKLSLRQRIWRKLFGVKD